MKRESFSLVVTTLNNAASLARCLSSVRGADEILVLDSGSTDDSVAIAHAHGARVHTQAFAGYGPQKQAAIDLAQHDWILLLDADEALHPESAAVIESALLQPKVAGFRLLRIEQRFWTFQHENAHHADMLRLFDRRRTRMSAGVHASPHTDGAVETLAARFLHFGEPDIATKVDKINRYSTALANERRPRSAMWHGIRMMFYPPWFFLRQYLIKRQFLNGWAGLIGSMVEAFYVFLKDAKALERIKKGKNQTGN